MNKDLLAFIEKVGIFGAQNGTPRSVSRVIGYLLICEPAAQSAKQIQEGLHLSAGAVSNALSLLKRAGMIRPVSIGGTRSLLYEIDPKSWKNTIEQRLKIVPNALEVVQTGLTLAPSNKRLMTMRRVYEAFEQESVRLIQRLDEIE